MPSRQLENLKNWRTQVYLKMGNMQDILHMELQDFIRIEDTLVREEKISHGEPILYDKLPNDNKDMIKRAKELKHG